MKQLVAAIILLCITCSPEQPQTVTEEPLPPDEVDAAAVPEPEPDAALVAEREPDVVTVPAAVALSNIERVSPHQDTRYAERCQEESRRMAPTVERVEGRDEARTQARLMARSRVFDTALLFARIAYGETGAPDPVGGANDDPSTLLWDEAAAFLAVIDYHRGTRSRAEMMATYAPRRIFPRPDDVRQQWLAEARLDGRTPPSWPAEHPSWRAYGCPRWLATVDAVKVVLEAHPDSIGAGPCEEVPAHWGGAMDTQAIENGWRRVTCAKGHVRNLFWALP